MKSFCKVKDQIRRTNISTQNVFSVPWTALCLTLSALGGGSKLPQSRTPIPGECEKCHFKLIWALLQVPLIPPPTPRIGPKEVSILNSSSWLAGIICTSNPCSFRQSSIRSSWLLSMLSQALWVPVHSFRAVFGWQSPCSHLLPLALTVFLPCSFSIIPEPWREGYNMHVPSVVDLCVNHCQLQTEASVMRVKRCSGLWVLRIHH